MFHTPYPTETVEILLVS
ncbi:hypothetical protein ABU162_22820 [Paenibacillus thiaminolyticus]